MIDGGAGGRAARYVNHSCAPNCEADEIGGRIFITSICDIPAGAELTYDYNMEAPRPLPRDWRQRYACLCGASRCRGTIVILPKKRRRAPNASVAKRASADRRGNANQHATANQRMRSSR